MSAKSQQKIADKWAETPRESAEILELSKRVEEHKE